MLLVAVVKKVITVVEVIVNVQSMQILLRVVIW